MTIEFQKMGRALRSFSKGEVQLYNWGNLMSYPLTFNFVREEVGYRARCGLIAFSTLVELQSWCAKNLDYEFVVDADSVFILKETDVFKFKLRW